MTTKAVIFDMYGLRLSLELRSTGQLTQVWFFLTSSGGVVLGSPVVGVTHYERAHDPPLPPNYLNAAITARGHSGAFQRLERGELGLEEFYEAFGRELSDVECGNEAYRRWCERVGKECPELPKEVKVDGRELWTTMMAQASTADPVVLTAINNLRLKTTLKIGALTNNFIVPSSSPTSSSSNAKPKDPAPRPRHHPLTIVELEGHMRSEHEKDESTRGSPAEVLKSVFDVFVESSVVGMRKPDPAFYEYALKQLGVMAEETVFLDDIGINLVAAKKLGIKTIRVHPGKSVDAVKELEGYVGVKLRDGAGDAKL